MLYILPKYTHTKKTENVKYSLLNYSNKWKLKEILESSVT